MKLTINADVFAEAADWTALNLPNRPSVPVMAGLLMDAGKKHVTLSSFDYDTSAKTIIDATIDQAGKIVVPGRLLADICRTLPAQPVTIESDETDATFTCATVQFKLRLLPAGEYPQIPTMPAMSGQVDAGEFARAVNQVVVASGRDELLPIYTGVRVEVDGDGLSLLTTDRYRMALRQLPWTPCEGVAAVNVIVPARVLRDTVKAMAASDQIDLSFAGEGVCGLHTDMRELTTRLLDGEFPQFRHLFTMDALVTVRAATEDLLAATRRVKLVAERNTALSMRIDTDHVWVSGASGDQAEASEQVDASVTVADGGALLTAGFNPHYLEDALSSVNSPCVQLSFTTGGQPCLIEGLKDMESDPDGTYKHLIMLMKLADEV